MKSGLRNLIIAILFSSMFISGASAESLFSARVFQNDYIQPRSLFYSPKARTVGDIVRILVEETIQIQDSQSLGTSKTSETKASFTNLLNSILGHKNIINENANGYGGGNSVSNDAQVQRKTAFTNEITAQVVQVLPNGNLVVQGHKTIINSGETTNIILSGVIDPRLIDQSGAVASSKVANLQYAISGSGAVSRANHEGLINKYIKYLF